MFIRISGMIFRKEKQMKFSLHRKNIHILHMLI